MTSLWSLLFKRSRHTAYARLDGDGKCMAFKTCTQPPGGNGWVEVNEIRLSWLGAPLPVSARACSRANRRWHPRSLIA